MDKIVIVDKKEKLEDSTLAWFIKFFKKLKDKNTVR